ncbi:MAG: hypothetical protein P8N09_07985 [Planctomycetota bacterium]|jgi:hypothetical protein|nr:hypothetical protein [Planctomycetota bacterium]
MVTTKKSDKAASASSKTKSKAKASGSTRTSSRSAKRRSPKDPPEDAELLEYERLQFLKAMDKYKRKTGKTFPSWTEVLGVLRGIGWMSPTRMSGLDK